MLIYIAILTFVSVVVSSLVVCRILMVLFRYVFTNTQKDREVNDLRDSYFKQMIERVQLAYGSITQMQEALDKKMDALSRFIDERNTYVIHQQEQFKAFAESDMLSARRDELVRVNELKVALERIMSMTTMSRQSPAAVDVLALESVTNRIKELEAILESS